MIFILTFFIQRSASLRGSENILNAVFQDEELYTKFHITLTTNRQEEGGIIQPIKIKHILCCQSLPTCSCWSKLIIEHC